MWEGNMLKLGIKTWAGRALALSVAVSAALAGPGRAWAGDGGPAWAPPQADGAGAALAPAPAAAPTAVPPGPAGAAVPVAPLATTVVAPAGAAGMAPPAARAGDPFSMAALAPERLERVRGGADAVWNDMKLSGAVSGNTAVNVATGSNIITNGSFSSASGLPIAIQNSGANVLIQNATIVNVQLR
jgi:hypothetical protein